MQTNLQGCGVTDEDSAGWCCSNDAIKRCRSYSADSWSYPSDNRHSAGQASARLSPLSQRAGRLAHVTVLTPRYSCGFWNFPRLLSCFVLYVELAWCCLQTQGACIYITHRSTKVASHRRLGPSTSLAGRLWQCSQISYSDAAQAQVRVG